jgi:hypothetical protein
MTASLDRALGSPCYRGGGSRSKLPASSKLMFMNTKVTFADRAALMRRAADDLRTMLAIIEPEAKTLTQPRQRFAAMKPAKRSAKSVG